MPPPEALAELGSGWISAARTAVLSVPSAVVPRERNYLLNPAHPDFGKIRRGSPEPFSLDSRLRPPALAARADPRPAISRERARETTSPSPFGRGRATRGSLWSDLQAAVLRQRLAHDPPQAAHAPRPPGRARRSPPPACGGAARPRGSAGRPTASSARRPATRDRTSRHRITPPSEDRVKQAAWTPISGLS